jgi:asparagine synthase (glutamine-hydrolysing)
MTEAIDRLWPDDGDVGLLLSGGIDSAIILSIAEKELNRPIRAFTFQYEDYEGRQNEVGQAKAVADHLGTPHELIPIRSQEIVRDLDGAVAAYDEPFTWGFHSYQLDPVVDRGITSLYSGLGAEGAAAPRRHTRRPGRPSLPQSGAGTMQDPDSSTTQKL